MNGDLYSRTSESLQGIRLQIQAGVIQPRASRSSIFNVETMCLSMSNSFGV